MRPYLYVWRMLSLSLAASFMFSFVPTSALCQAPSEVEVQQVGVTDQSTSALDTTEQAEQAEQRAQGQEVDLSHATPSSGSESNEAGSPPKSTPEGGLEEAQAQAPIQLGEMKREREEVPLMDRARSLLGMIVLLFCCWLLSNRRDIIPWRIIAWGIGLQILLGFLVMKTEAGEAFFGLVNGAFVKLMQFSNQGSKMLFGNLALMENVPVGAGGPFGPVNSTGQFAQIGAYLAFSVLPTIIFFSSLMAILYHSGIMERVVGVMAWAMRKTMKTSGSETLSASGNIFVGQTEAPLLVRPYLDKMTESELMAVMTGGFATVAGGVMAAYIGMLSPWFPDIAGHLLSASVMSAPAALVCAKLMIPEPDPTKSETYGEVKMKLERVDVNIIDAAARGAADGLKLALNVGGMLLAFMGLVYLANYIIALPSYLQHASELSGLRDAMKASSAGVASLAQAPACLSNPNLPWELAQDCGEQITTWAKTQSGLSLPKLQFWSVYTMQSALGFILKPIAWLMGVNWDQSQYVGQLLGVKTVLNEFIAYGDLGGMLSRGEVTGRGAVIATYALCGFANFGSIAIQLGGIGGVAPRRKGDLAKLGLRAMIGGSIAAMLTATVAGLLY